MKKTALVLIGITFVLTGCSQKNASPLFVQQEPKQDTIESTDSAVFPTDTPFPSASTSVVGKPKITPTPAPKPQHSALSITQLPSSFKSDNSRDLKSVDTLVIHTLYNPAYPNDLSITHAKAVLDESEVSSHYVIARDGKVYQLVQENYQAWQAGVSQMPAPDNRTGVNAFSLGIEIIATETSGITKAQYDSLTALVIDISGRLPIKNIVGHNDIAPGRKTDPWKFDWADFTTRLQKSTSAPPRILHK